MLDFVVGGGVKDGAAGRVVTVAVLFRVDGWLVGGTFVFHGIAVWVMCMLVVLKTTDVLLLATCQV